jgi:hypothetical protein
VLERGGEKVFDRATFLLQIESKAKITFVVWRIWGIFQTKDCAILNSGQSMVHF